MSGSLAPHRENTQPGHTLGWLGPFQLIEKLPGASGQIDYIARQRGPLDFERMCRLKVVRDTVAQGNEQVQQALAREASTWSKLDHPNILRFFDFVDVADRGVLVSEYFSGLSLDRLVVLLGRERKVLSRAVVWHIAHAVFDALAFSHSYLAENGEVEAIVHRDVRPFNVLVAYDGRVRLRGFVFGQRSGDTEITACGAVQTVPSYVAPEQVRGGGSTVRSDAFAAALMVWELLSRQEATPTGLTEYQLLQHLAERQVSPIRDVAPDVPPMVAAALDNCLVLDASQRTMTCGEVAGCIRACSDLSEGVRGLREAIAMLGPRMAKLAGCPLAGGNCQAILGLGTTAAVPQSPTGEYERYSGSLDDGFATPASMPSAPRTSANPPGSMLQDFASPSTEIGVETLAGGMLPDPVASYRPSQPLARLSQPVAVQVPPSLVTTSAGLAQADLARSGPMSLRNWVWLGATFGLVVACGSWIVLRQSKPSVPAVSTTAQPVTSSATTVAAAVQPVPSPSTVPSAQASIAAKALQPGAKQAVVVVRSPPKGTVYVQGRRLGATDTELLTDCGAKFLRVGAPYAGGGAGAVEWLSPGISVLLKCGKRVEVDALPPDESKDAPKR